MESKDIIIKARRLPSLLYAIVSLVFLFASIYCVILPATDTLSGPLALYIKIVYLIIGCIGIAFFGYKTTFHVIKLISPPISIIITDEGLLDHTIPDGGLAYVSWENIAEVKMFGDKKCDWLGISLRTTSKVFMGLTKASRAEISDNIDSGMPAIIIKATDISIDIYELRSMITARLGELNAGTRTRVMHNKPSVSQVYGSAQDKAVYKDDNFIIEPRLVDDDDDFDENASTAIHDLSNSIEPELEKTAKIDEIPQDAEEPKIEEPKAEEPKIDNMVKAEEKKPKITFEIIDEPEIEEETETTMQPKVKNGERFFEISRRPKKKSEVVKEEENIDDILSALSSGRKKDGE